VALTGSGAVVAVAMRGVAGQVGWIVPLSWDQLAQVFVAFSGGARPLLVPAAVGAVVAARAAWRGGERAFGAALALAWALGPVALAVAVSAVKPLLVPRYLLVALPGFALLLALGLLALRRPRWIALATAVAAVLALVEVGRGARRAEPLWQPVDEVARRLLEVTRPGDGLVVSHPALAVSLERELSRLGGARGLERVDPLSGDPLGLLHPDLPAVEERLAGRAGAIFVLAYEREPSARARAAYAAGARVAIDEELGDLRLLRLERGAEPAPPR